MMYDLILFDLDGTLTLPEEGITKSVQYALEGYGIIENDKEKLRRFIGPPLVNAFMEFYTMSKEDAQGALLKYRERFSVKGIFENELIDGIVQMLIKLKENGKLIALATSKPTLYAKQIVDNFKLTKYFDYLVGAEMDESRNKKEDVIKEVLRQCPNAQKPIMVGDRMHDIIGANINNIDSVGVLFGYGSKEELVNNGATYICGSVDELLNTLLL